MHKNNIPSLRRLIESDPHRARDFCLETGDFLVDYHRLPLERAGFEALKALPAARGLPAAFERLFTGAVVNASESRPALHMALRAEDPGDYAGAAAGAGLAAMRGRMLELADALYSGRLRGSHGRPVTDLVHLGIGGSDLGPRLVAQALETDASACRVHWLNGLDYRRWRRLAARLDPATTAVVIASKSFSTRETLLQAEAVRDWLGPTGRALTYAATARSDRARDYGIPPENILELPESVGGRFSLWSAVGLSAAVRVGAEAFSGLLEGAARADRETRAAPGCDTLPVLLALLMHGLRVECGYPSLGVISYEPRLGLLAEWLQQLVMESLGKQAGGGSKSPGAPVIFGGRGTELQHSLFQALHQNPVSVPVLLVGCVDNAATGPWRDVQLAHLLAQGAVLASGRDRADPARHLPGDRPSISMLVSRLDAQRLGYLLAAFEHAVYALGCLWGVNPFDQWGVEEGKRTAGEFERQLADSHRPAEGDSERLLAFIRRHTPRR